MADSNLIEILGVIIVVFSGGILTLMIYFANGIKDQVSEMDEKIKGLSVEMNAGFAQVNKRIDKVDRRIDGVNQRIDKVDQRIDRVDQRISSLLLH
ncbi:MAG: hypothetical protein F4135_09130 [Acidimicrobiia bacterium]|nr:hypothetical protein [Acidimicrobiia bacterium]